MKKVITLLQLLFASLIVFAQNVGIGTTSPAELLHLFSNSTDVKIRLTSVANDTRSGTEYVTGGGASDFSRFGAAAGSSTAGISMNGNTRLYTSGGSLLIGNDAAQPIYFVTNNEVKMTLNGNGNVGLGTGITGDDRLVVSATAGRGIISTTTFVPGPSNFTSAVAGIVSTTSLRAHGITGVVQNASGGTTGTIGGMYGVVGTAIEAGYGMGAFGAAGAGGIFSYVFSGSGKALSTFGAVQLQNIGEGAGRVLTSDASGNANWQSLPTGSNAWTVAGNNIYNNNSGRVGVGISSPTANLHINTGIDGRLLITNDFTGTTLFDGLSLRMNGLLASISNSENDDLFLSTNISGAVGAYGSPQIWIKSSGAIGIGTSTPGAKLEVAGVGSAQPAININDGFLKVSGANKTAFTVTGTVANSATYLLYPGYANQSASDILIVTHNYNPPGVGGTYHNVPVGVYWDGLRWSIYSEDTATPMLGKSFNVLVIKQ